MHDNSNGFRLQLKAPVEGPPLGERVPMNTMLLAGAALVVGSLVLYARMHGRLVRRYSLASGRLDRAHPSTAPVMRTAFEAPGPSSGEPVCVTGLDKGEAEALLDWLEVHGCSHPDVTCRGDEYSIRYR